MIVSIVTRTVYGEEQFSGLNRARINRDAGQPGQGVEARGRRDTQTFSHLTNRPPHSVSNGLGFTRKPALSKVLDFAAEIRRKTWMLLGLGFVAAHFSAPSVLPQLAMAV
jgi:hypothetical protein